jgi:diguanylate cyclase (GGDEF)-like protein
MPDAMNSRYSVFSFGVRQKMLAILMTVLVIAISISSWFTLQKQEQDLYDAINIRGGEVVKHASHAISLYAVSYDYHSIQILLDGIVNSPDIIHAHVTSSKGNTMAAAGPTAADGEQRPTFRRALEFDNRPVGELTVELDPRDIVRRVEENRNALLLRELALIILVAIGEFIGLSYFIARPVSIISHSLEESVDQDGRISKNIPLETKDEFGRLASQFNMMRQQLNTAHARLQDRIEAADARLLETNQALLHQSEELKEMNKRLVELSITDPLTGLYNRRHFESMITKELAHSARHGNACSLMIMDIDRFKVINDTYGHAVGDEVLRHIAQIIRDSIRSGDIPCRIGGEEFVVACRNTNELEATQLAERLRRAAAQATVQLEDLSIEFTMSVGIATLRTGRNKLTLNTIFEYADRALYHSKQQGRNRVTHHSELERPEPDTDSQGANS